MCGTPHFLDNLGVPVVGRNDFDHQQGRTARNFLVRFSSGKYGNIRDTVQVGGKPHASVGTDKEVMRIPKLDKFVAKFNLHPAMRIVRRPAFEYLSAHVFPIGSIERCCKVFGGRHVR
jgi:hypothetical protein